MKRGEGRVDEQDNDVVIDTLLATVRHRMRRLLPGACESTDDVTGMFTYAYGEELADLACVVARHEDHVRLGFYNAGSLADPEGVLRRWGTRHGYVEVVAVADLDQDCLLDLLAGVRARHACRTDASTRSPEAHAPSPGAHGSKEYPAAEALVCLLAGLLVGALFAAALDSRAIGLLLGLSVATALLWVKKLQCRSPR